MVFNQNNSGYKLVTIRRITLFTHEWANKNLFFVKDLVDKHRILEKTDRQTDRYIDRQIDDFIECFS